MTDVLVYEERDARGGQHTRDTRCQALVKTKHAFIAAGRRAHGACEEDACEMGHLGAEAARTGT